MTTPQMQARARETAVAIAANAVRERHFDGMYEYVRKHAQKLIKVALSEAVAAERTACERAIDELRGIYSRDPKKLAAIERATAAIRSRGSHG